MTTSIGIGRSNVGRIAERIAANELEYRGFRVSDLNKEGLSANADLLAVKDGKSWQIQVKGATWDKGWWFNYGPCNESIINDKNERMFNRHDGFYRAQIVILVCVKTPQEYCCIVLDVDTAEKLAQMNLDCEYRTKKKDGSAKKPHKVWSSLNYIPTTNDLKTKAMEAEQQLLSSYKEKWEVFDSVASC